VGVQLKKTAQPVLFRIVPKREVLEAVRMLPLGCRSHGLFFRVIHSMVVCLGLCKERALTFHNTIRDGSHFPS